MAARFGGDIPMMQATSMHKASDNMTAAQREALARGPGHKRAPEETTIFKELQQMANMAADDSDLEEANAPIRKVSGKPADLTKRREYAALQEVQPNAAAGPSNRKAPANARRRRAIVDDDSDGGSSSGWSAESEELDVDSDDSEIDEAELV